jgi:hypothetical protein
MAENIIQFTGKDTDKISEIKQEYIQGIFDNVTGKTHYPSIRELSETHSLSVSTLRFHSEKERWGELRSLVKAKLKERRTAEEIKTMLSASSGFDSSTLEAAEKAFKIINHEFDGYLSNAGTEESIVDPRKIKSLVDSLVQLNQLTRKILGDDVTIEGISEELKLLQEESRTEREDSSNAKLTELQTMLNDIKKARKEIETNRYAS